jgi:hypothetical protein
VGSGAFAADYCSGKWENVGNKSVKIGVGGSSVGWKPSSYYPYTAESISEVESKVPSGAGVGKITFDIVPVVKMERMKIVANTGNSAAIMYNSIGAKLPIHGMPDKNRNATGLYILKHNNTAVLTNDMK